MIGDAAAAVRGRKEKLSFRKMDGAEKKESRLDPT